MPSALSTAAAGVAQPNVTSNSPIAISRFIASLLQSRHYDLKTPGRKLTASSRVVGCCATTPCEGGRQDDVSARLGCGGARRSAPPEGKSEADSPAHGETAAGTNRHDRGGPVPPGEQQNAADRRSRNAAANQRFVPPAIRILPIIRVVYILAIIRTGLVVADLDGAERAEHAPAGNEGDAGPDRPRLLPCSGSWAAVSSRAAFSAASRRGPAEALAGMASANITAMILRHIEHLLVPGRAPPDSGCAGRDMAAGKPHRAHGREDDRTKMTVG